MDVMEGNALLYWWWFTVAL